MNITQKRKRCPKGSRIDKKTGNCIDNDGNIVKYASPIGVKTIKKIPLETNISGKIEQEIQTQKLLDLPSITIPQSEIVQIPRGKSITDMQSVKEDSEHKSEVDTFVNTIHEKIISIPNKVDKTRKRCPKGTRMNPKTGNCDKYDPITKKFIEPAAVMRQIPTTAANTKTPAKPNFVAVYPEGNIEDAIYIQKPEYDDLPIINEEDFKTQMEKETQEENKEIEEELQEMKESIESASKEKEMIETSPNETKNMNEIDDLIRIGVNDNVYLSDLEKKEYASLKDDTSNSYLYPTLNDPNFNIKIASKQEFNSIRYDGTIDDIKKRSNDLCNAEFEFLPHQLFVKNFMSLQGPYNSLLLYHGLGTGKTCSAIGIAEEMRAYMKQVGIKKRILVVASPNVQYNFRQQLFNKNKLNVVAGTSGENTLWELKTCVGQSLLKEINPTALKGLPKQKVINMINNVINASYEFMGYGQLVNYIIQQITIPNKEHYSEKEQTQQEIKKIKNVFNNRLIIIDEFHNIRLTDENVNKKAAMLLMKLAKHTDNMRLLFLSATPLFNSYKEIIWITNLMNLNDKRSTIELNDVFDKEGNFRIGEEGQEGGEDLLRRKLIGYVSYVRGENPYTFPYRIYPDKFVPEKTFQRMKYPSIQLNGKPIKTPLKHINVYINNCGSYQETVYSKIVGNIKSTFEHDLNVDEIINNPDLPLSDNSDTLGYIMLQEPLQALNIVFPNRELDLLLQNVNTTTKEKSISDSLTKNTTNAIITQSIGSSGLNLVVKFKEDKSLPIRYNFEYRQETLDAYGPIFNEENINKYSAKIGNICNIIKQSKGIHLIYSQYIDSGVIPIALALEEMGFSRYCSSPQYNKQLFKEKHTEPIDVLTMKPRGATVAEGKPFMPARYIMITGDKSISPSNGEDIKLATDPENMNGEQIKVIIISKAGSEGIDFKHIRQVHILESWYNMNRIEQIIGRAVRNKSHCEMSPNGTMLPFEERNVEIYLHGTMLSNQEEEAADLYVYRLAEKKALQIGKITRLIKENAVDCILNIAQTNFTAEKMYQMAQNQNIQINLASGMTIDFRIGDQPFTDICDYMDTCEYTCKPSAEPDSVTVSKETYNTTYAKSNLDKIIERIKELFKEKHYYSREKLLQLINLVKQYPIEEIYFSLTYLIKNKNELITDKYGRLGNLINKGDIYAFQPIEITDTNASIYERIVPVEYKKDNIKLEINKEFIKENAKKDANFFEPTINKKENIRKKQEQLQEKETTDIPEFTMVKKKINKANVKMVHEDEPEVETQEILEQPLPTSGTDYKSIIDEITRNYNIVFGEKLYLTMVGKNWYKNANTVIEHIMTVYDISLKEAQQYIVEHAIDTLSLEEKLEILNNIIDTNNNNNTNIENKIKNYFESKYMQSRGQTGIVLSSKNSWKIYIKQEDEWKEGTPEDYRGFGEELKRFIVNGRDLNDIIGFINLFKDKETVFKIKDFSGKRNNLGARCDSKSKGDVVKLLNLFLNKEVYDPKINYFNFGLCSVIEIIMRHFTRIKKDGKVYFLNPEEASLNNIANLNKK